jgi:uncharacterized glyoxalase superfamily protein PhnB
MMAELDLAGIVVRDMPAALKFYRLLGLDIPAEADQEQHVEHKTRHGFRLAWDTLDLMRTIDPDWPEPSGHRIGLAFLCDSPAEVDALYEQVVAAGYKSHKPPWDAFWGQRYAVVVDPDGNLIDLFASQ